MMKTTALGILTLLALIPYASLEASESSSLAGSESPTERKSIGIFINFSNRAQEI